MQLPQMCAWTRFALLVVGTMVSAFLDFVYVSRAGRGQIVRTQIVDLLHAPDTASVRLFRRIPLHNACAITGGVAVHANERLCMKSCGRVLTTAKAMVFASTANVSAMLVLTDQIALARSVRILR